MTLQEWKAIVDDNPEKLFTEYKAESYIPIVKKLNVAGLAALDNGICIVADDSGYATISVYAKSLFLMQM